MRRRLPAGEEDLPFMEEGGRYVTLREIRSSPVLLFNLLRLSPGEVSQGLLVERVRRRHMQGREPGMHVLGVGYVGPEEMIRHMEAGDEIGRLFIEMERKLLEEELGIVREWALGGT